VQEMEGQVPTTKGGSKAPWIVLVIVIIIVAVAAFLFRDKLFGSKAKNMAGWTAPAAGSSGFQAVFLTNGQVYFGMISDSGNQWVTLKNIYYLQVAQAPVQGSQPTAGQQQPQISLVKLGNELHGPQDEMKINRDQILFYEDMKDSAKVIEAIKEYQKNPPAQGGAQQNTNTAPAANTNK